MKTRLRLLAVMGLALLGTAACDDNPVGEGRADAKRFTLNPSTAAVVSGGDSIIVNAILVNEYGEPTGGAVTAEPCDPRITVTRSEQRLDFEAPERFVVRAAGNLGRSCLVVSGGGVTDTIELRVVPASFRVSVPDTIESGAAITPTVQFFDKAGNPVTGLTAANVTFTATNIGTRPGPVATGGSQVRGFWPGTARVTATLGEGFPIVAADTIVVKPKPITLSTQSALGGTLITATAPTAPATPTAVRAFFNAKESFVHNVAGTQITLAVGAPGSINQMWIAGLEPNVIYGSNFVVPRTVITASQTVTDVWERNIPPATTFNNTRAFANPIVTFGQPMYMNMHIGEDRWDYLTFNVTAPTKIRLRMDFFDDAEMVIWTYNVAGYVGTDVGTETGGCEPADHGIIPECIMTITTPGQYWLRLLKLADDTDGTYTPVRLRADIVQ